MKIVRVSTHALTVRVTVPCAGLELPMVRHMNHVEIETDAGIVGHGAAGHTQPSAIAALIDRTVPDLLVGHDPLHHEALTHKLEWTLARRGQSGLAWHAISAVDTALWDLKGKILGQPLWRLLGGARSRVPLYATFGLPALGPEVIGLAASELVAEGFRGLKMVVGDEAEPTEGGSDRLPRGFDRDVERVRAVREAVGDDVDLFVSAQSRFSLAEALHFARRVEPYGIALFQEPTIGNDPGDLATLRQRTGIPTAIGHSLGGMVPFRDALLRDALDYVQPNVVSSGGYTTAARVASLARAFGVRVHNGGGWLHHNIHLHAGLSNTTLAEWFPASDIATLSEVYEDLPGHDRGWFKVTERPGLGFEPKAGALAHWAV